MTLEIQDLARDTIPPLNMIIGSLYVMTIYTANNIQEIYKLMLRVVSIQYTPGTLRNLNASFIAQ